MNSSTAESDRRNLKDMIMNLVRFPEKTVAPEPQQRFADLYERMSVGLLIERGKLWWIILGGLDLTRTLAATGVAMTGSRDDADVCVSGTYESWMPCMHSTPVPWLPATPPSPLPPALSATSSP